MNNRILAVLVGLALLFASDGCKKEQTASQNTPAKTLSVFAAASLTESFRDIGKKFEAGHPGVSVSFNFAGSQQLREQLNQGAPADVFASANPKEMNSAIAGGHIAPGAAKNFVQNRLVVIFPKNNPAKIESLADLAKSGLKLDVADPAVPVGKYTMQMLDAINKGGSLGVDFKAKVLANVVSREENVKSVVSKVRLGEADAGVVYVTDVTAQAASDVATLPVPDTFNQIADYPIAVTARAANAPLAGEFVAFILSPDGQQILSQYGFQAPRPTTQP